ncbi:MAG TPA: hypothetical protein VFF02_00205 [Anaeromyxobacteraceae bacterium]|nr:hypothetical protein [Anaeromyxobacteraceae bacterium]
MTTAWLMLKLLHLLGMALMIGAEAVKITLVAAARSNAALSPVYLRVAKPVTRLIVLGLALAILSGIGWIALGRPFTPVLLAKLVLVVALGASGAFIDKVVEPRFARLAAEAGTAASPELARIGRQYLAVEIAATALTCAIAVLGVLL